MCAAGNIITQTSHSLKRVAGLNFFYILLIQSDWKYSRNWLNQTTEFCRSICKWGKYSSDQSKVTLPALHRIFIFALHRIFMYVTVWQYTTIMIQAEVGPPQVTCSSSYLWVWIDITGLSPLSLQPHQTLCVLLYAPFSWDSYVHKANKPS